MKKVLGLAVAMAMASQVNAAIDLPLTDVNNTGGSELVLVVWDADAKTTYTRDLGIGYRAFNDSNVYSFAADARMSSLFGSTLSSSLVWGVWASDSVDSGLFDENFLPVAGRAETWGASFMTTSSKEALDLPTVILSRDIAGANYVFTNFLNATNGLENGDHLSQENGSSTAVEGMNAKSADVGYAIKTNWSTEFPVNTMLGVNQNAYFMLAQSVYEQTFIDLDGDGEFTEGLDIIDFAGDFEWAAAMTQFAGTWKLDDQGTLTWAATPAEVPVPAAVWLFVSGLAGLAGIARRQNA